MPAESKEYKAPPDVRDFQAKRNRDRRAHKDVVMVEIPRVYRDWFKAYALSDGTTMAVAIGGALEMFIDEEGGLSKFIR